MPKKLYSRRRKFFWGDFRLGMAAISKQVCFISIRLEATLYMAPSGQYARLCHASLER